ncbi:MAG: MaoC family dehydratase [Lachnospiraceae bacterium]|nr:MaoC family dehydratase [Lachnospiraceae bacterium]
MNTYHYDEIAIGHTESFEALVKAEDMESFKAITGDINPLHNDETFAGDRGYEGRVVYGMLTASYLSTLAGVYLPGERSLIRSVSTKFYKAVFIGDRLTIEGKVSDKNDTFKLLTVKINIKNQKGEKVLKGEMEIQVLEVEENE